MLLGFFSHWLASNLGNHLHSCSFHSLMVPSWALSKGRAFRSDLILFHTQELHHTWQVLGIQPGQEVPGLGQGSPRRIILQSKELCEAPSISVRVLPLPLHPVCLRPFPLDYLLKSIPMDFLIVIFFSFFFNSFPTTPPQHFPSLVTGVLASSPPLHQSTVSSQGCNLYNFSCLLCLIVSFVISHPLSLSVHSEYPGWLK